MIKEAGKGPRTCTLFNSLMFLFMNSERVRDFGADKTFLEAAEGCVLQPTVNELFELSKKLKAPKKPVFSAENYTHKFTEVHKIENFDLFLAKMYGALKSVSLKEMFGEKQPEDGEVSWNGIIDYMLGPAVEVLSELEPSHYLVYLERLLYFCFEEVYPQPPPNPEDPTEERSLGEMIELLKEEENLKKLKQIFTDSPLNNALSFELFRNFNGDNDVDMTHEDASSKVLRLFGLFCREYFETKSAKDLLDSKLFSLDVPNSTSTKIFNWAPSVSVAHFQITQQYVHERTSLSVEFFIPNSIFYAMQKVRVVREIELVGDHVLKDPIPEEQATPFDTPQWPTCKSLIEKLKGDVSYVTDDFDWKCIFYDFASETFISLHNSTIIPKLPLNLSDYAYFFSSKHLGWASQEIMTIPIVTTRKLRYLTNYLHNITLFVAPNPNTPLEYLLEYIRLSINQKLVEKGDNNQQLQEILKHVRFIPKLHSELKRYDFALSTKLCDIRQAVNPDFNSKTREVDFICYFSYPTNPMFLNYRSKDQSFVEVFADPTASYIESLKPSATSVISFIQRRTYNNSIKKALSQTLLNGRNIQTILPLFMIVDTRNINEQLFDPIQPINFAFIKHLLSQTTSRETTTKYKLRGAIVFNRKTKEYYPIAIRPDLENGRSLETGNPTDIKLSDFSEQSIHYIFMEKDEPKI